MILMNLSEFLIAKKMVDEVKKNGPKWEEDLENGLQVVKKINEIAREDQDHQNPVQTGNVYTKR